jgi:hypothetical protein
LYERRERDGRIADGFAEFSQGRHVVFRVRSKDILGVGFLERVVEMKLVFEKSASARFQRRLIVRSAFKRFQNGDNSIGRFLMRSDRNVITAIRVV